VSEWCSNNVPESNTAVAVSWSADDGVREWWVEVDRIYPDHAGRYTIGALGWRWSIAD